MKDDDYGHGLGAAVDRHIARTNGSTFEARRIANPAHVVTVASALASLRQLQNVEKTDC